MCVRELLLLREAVPRNHVQCCMERAVYMRCTAVWRFLTVEAREIKLYRKDIRREMYVKTCSRVKTDVTVYRDA